MRPNTDSLDHFGSYRIEGSLGRGGMGEVYLAFDERLHRHVALKRLRKEAGDRLHYTRFLREARAVARLNHRAIVQIYDILETERGLCLVMELVAGPTLGELIRHGRVGLHLTLRVARQIAGGLAEAHDQGLVHRDLKADNIVLDAKGQAKILDFGLACPLCRDEDDFSRTPEGVLVGTAHTMAPEQARGEPADLRSDLFSLGVLLYEMITGHSPFRGPNLIETLQRVIHRHPRPVSDLQPGTPVPLEDLVDRLLQKDPEDRYQSARLVARLLDDVRSRLPGEASHGKAPVSEVRPVGPEDGTELDDLPTASGLQAPVPRPEPSGGARRHSPRPPTRGSGARLPTGAG